MKVLISSRSFGKIESGAIEMLEQAGLTPVLNPHGRKLNENEIIELMDDDTVGIIAGTESITKPIMERSSSLKVISRYGVGLDNVDLQASKELGIYVNNTPEAPAQAVAELTITMILNLLKKISELDSEIKAGNWKPKIGNLLSKKTVGIIGLGRIGRTLVKLIEPFQTRVLAFDLEPDKEFASKYNIELVPLIKLISDSDIISLHVPITEGTRGIIGQSELDSMKDNVLVINTARGGLIDEDALVRALENNKLGGVAVDAFETEPYEGRLKEFKNAVLSPHIGTFTEETRKQMEIESVENIIYGLKEAKLL